MKLGAFQSFHGDVFLTPPPPVPPVIYITVRVQAYTSRSLLSIVRLM